MKGYNLLGALIGIVSIAVAINYYMSYKWFSEVFSYYGINMLPLIDIRDLTFPLGQINLQIVSLVVIGSIMVIGINLILPFNKKEINIVNEIKSFYSGFKQSKNYIKIGFILFFIFMTTLLVVTFPKEKGSPLLLVLFILLVFILPIAYALLKSKRIGVGVIYTLLFWIWINKFIEVTVDKMAKNISENISHISFEYDGEIFCSSEEGLNLIYGGYKNYIFYNEIKEQIIYYPTNEIGKVSYSKNDTICLKNL